MNADQCGRGFYIAHDERDGFLDAAIAVRAKVSAKAVDAERAPTRGKVRGCNLLGFVLTHCLHYSGTYGLRLGIDVDPELSLVIFR